MDFKNLNLNKVLDDFDQNFRKDYDILFNTLKSLRGNNASVKEPDEATLIAIVKQFHVAVVRLGSSHVHLVKEILNFDWTTRSNELSQEYEAFVLDLLTAQTALYLHDCLKTIVTAFIPKEASVVLRFYADVLPEELTSMRLGDQKKHNLLMKIVKIVPSSVLILETLISQCNPHLAKLWAQESYTLNLLDMCSYLPHVRGLVLQIIVNNMITYDSEASREEIKKMEEEENNNELNSETKVRNIRCNQVNLLDCLMKTMLTYIKETCFQHGELMWEVTKKLYIDLKKTFSSLLLRTFKTYHVQFLMFYICSFKMDLTLDFLEFLWMEVTSVNKDHIHRQLAASYLGSLMARAKYIPTWLIKRQLVRMKNWIHNYIDNCSEQFRPLFEVHGVFYLVCQSLFYIIVFRHKDVMDSAQGHKFCMDLQLQRITSCLLNPLRFCFLPITEMFCSVVRSNQIVFCDNILERNRRQMVAESTNNYFRNVVVSYFPFDPYALHRSIEFIEPHYLDYDEELFKMEIKQKVLDEFMDYEEFEEKDQLTFDISQDIDVQLSPKIKNFFLYSTSPGFKH